MASRRNSRGVSLSRGPALLVGLVLLVAGLYFLYKFHDFPSFHNAPSGEVHYTHKVFFHIFGLNGWSAELTAAAGGLLLLGAAEHWLAKFASFLVMVALGGVAIWALVHHHSAIGLFAASIWTIVLWGAAALVLLFNVMLPRAGTATTVEPGTGGRTAPDRAATTVPAVQTAPDTSDAETRRVS